MKYIIGYILLLLCIRLDAQQFNFTEHIKPIISAKCYSCHNQNGASPVRLENYTDVKGKAGSIKNVVQKGIMPLWKADKSYSHFQNEQTITEEERGTLIAWIDGGMEKGKGNDKINLKSISSTSAYGKPDYTLKIKSPYFVKGDNEETYSIIKIPFEFDSAFDVKLFEFLPSLTKQIHHVSIFILEQKPGYPDMMKGNDRYTFSNANFDIPEGFNVYNYLNVLPENQFQYWNLLAYKTHWQPGMSAKPYPEGMGFRMPKKGVILLDMIHYVNSTKEVQDDIIINLFKHKQSVTRRFISASVGVGDMAEYSDKVDIKPGEKKWLYAKTKLPGDMSLFEISPHMHLIARKFISFAVTPRGDTIPLIKIDDWDMYWQETYRFKSLIKIPKDSYLYVKGYYDNTNDNPANPSNPPKHIQSSMAKQDEMLLMVVTFLDYIPRDENKSLQY